MTALRLAVLAWARKPERARHDIIHFFADEAEQSREWAKEDHFSSLEQKRHRQDAIAIEAAVALLRAAEKPARKVRRK